MCIDGRLRRVRSWRRALQASALVVMTAGCGPLVDEPEVSALARAAGAQSTSEDPCRFATAEAVGKAFGRPMQSSKKRVDVCQYGGTPTGLVVVKVTAGPEGTILRHVRRAAAQGHKDATKATTAVGEGYFDAIIPVFIGRVGNYDVQVETDIEPVPRDAMIAVGTRIMETLAGK